MTALPKKVVVIGLDGLPPKLIAKHLADGHLPAMKKIIDGGVIADNCLVPFPTITPPNWACIATGAYPGTHNVLDMWIHKSGDPLDPAHCPMAFSSKNCKAEFIWDALDKAGKKSIVFNYPGSWPSKMKNGVMVGGHGLAVAQQNDGFPLFGNRIDVTGNQLFTTGYYSKANRGKFQPATGWKNVPEMGEDPLEMVSGLNFFFAKEEPGENTWYILVRQLGKDGYDTVTLSPTRDFKDALCTLKVGEWSPKVRAELAMKDGSKKGVAFHCKLIELSADAEDFRLYATCLMGTEGWTSPPEVAKQITSEGIAGSELVSLLAQWFDFPTWLEINDMYSEWHADTAVTLMKENEWDAFFMHYHSPDWIYHYIISLMDPDLNKDKNMYEMAWAAHLMMCQSMDRMVDKITRTLSKDTLVILVSDHGATPDGPTFNPYRALVPAGLAKLSGKRLEVAGTEDMQGWNDDVEASKEGSGTIEEIKMLGQIPDIKNCKAVPLQSCYIYINLKGRDPDGIVDPKDYAKVQKEIIDALYTYVDPRTGTRPVALALSREDARILGLHGEDCGDVVYAIYPNFGMQHGNILPTAEWGVGSLRGLLVMNGPNIKKGLHLDRTCSLPDIVPTICYMLKWPLPENAEGGVLYQVFKDPNFLSEEFNKMQAALNRMEVALQRGERQPWDKHECA